MKAKYIPNILSVLRLLMAFGFAAVFIWLPDKLYIAAILFALGGVTDVVDGKLARKFNWVTDAGKIIDPIADKLMQCIALICLFTSHIVPFWILIPIILKELTMGVGSIIFYQLTKQIGVSKNYGKAYTVVFYFCVGAFIIFRDWFTVHVWATYALCIFTAVVGFIAIVLYYRTYLTGKIKFGKNRKANTDGDVREMP